jgi:autotransporter-associated beta strand protein
LTITLNEPVTLGMLVLGSGTPGVGYTLSGSGSNTLTFNNSGSGATITVTDGSHVIDAPVVLADNLVVTNGGTNAWTLSFGTASSITDNGGGYSLTMNGAGGTLILSGSNTYTGGTTVNSGVLTFLNRTAQPPSGMTTVAAGATLGLGVGPSANLYGSADLDALFARTISNVTSDPNSNVGIDTTAGNFTYSSNIPATTMGLTKLGPNTLTLTGANASPARRPSAAARCNWEMEPPLAMARSAPAASPTTPPWSTTYSAARRPITPSAAPVRWPRSVPAR